MARQADSKHRELLEQFDHRRNSTDGEIKLLMVGNDRLQGKVVSLERQQEDTSKAEFQIMEEFKATSMKLLIAEVHLGELRPEVEWAKAEHAAVTIAAQNSLNEQGRHYSYC